MTINSSYSRTTYKRKILQLQTCSTKDSCTFLSYTQFNDTDYLKHLRLLSSQYLQLSLYHSIYRTFFFSSCGLKGGLQRNLLCSFKQLLAVILFLLDAFMKVQPLLRLERNICQCVFFCLNLGLLLNVSLYGACSNRSARTKPPC